MCERCERAEDSSPHFGSDRPPPQQQRGSVNSKTFAEAVKDAAAQVKNKSRGF